MASNRMIRREIKRTALSKKYEARREELQKRSKDPSVSLEEKYAIQAEYAKMPRDSANVRRTRRCEVTGRAHGVYRKFSLGRTELRRVVMRGEVPGAVKSSW